MRLLLIFLTFVFFGCSRDIQFVRVNQQLPERVTPSTIQEVKAEEITAHISDEPAVPTETINQMNVIEESHSEKCPKKKIQSPDDNVSYNSLTQIVSAKYDHSLNQQQSEKLNKRLQKLEQKGRMFFAPPPPPQKGKTYLGAILMIVGAFVLLAGIFSIFGSPAGWWAILLGALLFIAGVAFLVSGSLSTKHQPKEEQEQNKN